MGTTVKDWKDSWFEVNGESDSFEVIINDSGAEAFSVSLYAGSFKDIPADLLGADVLQSSRILDSSAPERVGAYLLTVDAVSPVTSLITGA